MMAAATSDEFRDGFPFLAGQLWLDLLNTTPTPGGVAQDLIATPGDAARWLAASGLAGSTGTPTPDEIGAELRALREELRPAVETLARGEPLAESLMASINRRLAGLTGRHQLQQRSEGFALSFVLDRGVAAPAALIARDFADFVCEAEPARLRHCASDCCSLVFYDRGRNNTRRWCSMSACGNRDKVARFRARRVGAGG